MRHQPTVPSEVPKATPPPAAGWRWLWGVGRLLACCGRGCHRLVVLVQWSVCLFLALAAWLSLVGVPSAWVEGRLNRLRARGVYMTVGRVRLDILAGIAFDDVVVFETPGAPRPILRAERLTLAIDPRAWWRGEGGVSAVRLREGRLDLDPGFGERGATRAPPISIEVPSALVRMEPDGWRLVRCRAEAFGMRWRGSGLVHRPPAGLTPKPAPSASLPAVLAQARREASPWLSRALQEIRRVALLQPPEGVADFEVWTAHPEQNKVALKLAGRETRYRGVTVTRWEAAVNGSGMLWTARGNVQQGVRSLAFNGTYDATSRQVQVQMTNALPASLWLALLPASGREACARAGLAVRGPFAFELDAGPAPLRQVLEKVQGRVSARDMEVRGVALPALQAAFRRDGAQLVLSDIKATVGRDRQRGTAAGRCTVDLAAHNFQGELRTSFDPHALLPLLSDGNSNLLSQVQFFGPPPDAELSFSGQSAPDFDVRLSGRCAARDFSFRAVPVVSARALLTLANGVLDLQEACIVRKEGCSRGRVTINFDDHLLELDAQGTADPRAVAQMVGGAFFRFMQHFEFQEPLQAVVCGRLDIGPTMRATRLRASAQGVRLGWRKLLADYGAFDLLLDGPSLTITNATGVIYAGPFTGAATFSNITSSERCPFTLATTVTNADFARLVQTLGRGRGFGSQTYPGNLSTAFQLAGVIGPDLAASTAGAGWVQVTEGQLLRIPLFGGLFQMLGKVVPGLGGVAQSELTASFDVRDKKIQSQDLRIKGSVISLSSHGACSFDGDLDFQIQVQLLREGLTADLLRLLTFPVTKLLEFRLIGTMQNPRWRPVNLPKELFLQFD